MATPATALGVKATSEAVNCAPLALSVRVVLYDGVCNLCNKGIAFVAKRDPEKKIHFCSVQSKRSEPYLVACRLSRQDVLKRFVFIDQNKYSSGSTAALDIVQHLRYPWPALTVLKAVPTPWRDRVYDYVATNRYKWFGKTDECQVPDTSVLSRCIDAEELVMKKCYKMCMEEDGEDG